MEHSMDNIHTDVTVQRVIHRVSNQFSCIWVSLSLIKIKTSALVITNYLGKDKSTSNNLCKHDRNLL